MISAAPGTESFQQGVNLAESSANRGEQVYLYYIDTAVDGLSESGLAELKAKGIHLFACAFSLQRRGLTPPPEATLSGLTVLSDVIASTNEFHSFNNGGSIAPPRVPSPVRTLLIEIASDPRTSPRPAEAVRIAAGIGAWRKVQVHVYFEGVAVRALDEFADELANGELFSQYMSAIPNHGGRILVDEKNPLLESIKPSIHFEALPQEELQQFIAMADHVMRF